MSQENVEIARQQLEAFSRRDVEAIRGFIDPAVELDWSASAGVDARVYRGIDAYLRFWTSYFEAFDEIAVSPERFIDRGESVVIPNVARFRGRDGIEVLAESTVVFTIRNRKITHIRLYQETADALKAVGLEE
jgi:ketosteroid isomerase-like protein